MSLFHALLLGIVEGFTEFLPISSTAHLVLATKLLHIAESDFIKTFIIVIQLGAILAVILLYFRRLFRNPELMKRVVVAFLPTAAIGFVLYKIIKSLFLENLWIILASLFVGGVALIAFEKLHRPHDRAVDMLSYKQAFFVGCAQSLAVVPGVSRAAATIVGGILLGIPRALIVEFSFLLAIPTMAAAAGYDLLKNASVISVTDFSALAVGFITSFVFAWLGVKFLLNYISRHSFTGFGMYRICLVVLTIGVML